MARSEKEDLKEKARKIAEALSIPKKKNEKIRGHKVEVKGLVIFKAYYKGRILDEGDVVMYRGHTDKTGNLPRWIHPLDKIKILEESKAVKSKKISAASDKVQLEEDSNVIDPDADAESSDKGEKASVESFV